MIGRRSPFVGLLVSLQLVAGMAFMRPAAGSSGMAHCTTTAAHAGLAHGALHSHRGERHPCRTECCDECYGACAAFVSLPASRVHLVLVAPAPRREVVTAGPVLARAYPPTRRLPPPIGPPGFSL